MNATDITNDISRRFDEITDYLDRLEEDLPAIPARALGLTRATVHRVNDVAIGVATDVARQVGLVTGTAETAVSTTVGQARSAVDRTTKMAKKTANETTGQARAQASRTVDAAAQATSALLDDATRAVEPDGNGRPASLDNWSKAELYERAQELDIEGRSSMSKRELVKALRAA